MEKQVNGALNVLFCTQPESTPSHCCAIGPSDNGGGQVEKNVRDARSRLWQVMPIFTDLAELNLWLEERCVALWAETKHRELPGTIADVWEAEKPTLMALPPAFDGFVEHEPNVSRRHA